MTKLFNGLTEIIRNNDMVANIFTWGGIALMVLILLW